MAPGQIILNGLTTEELLQLLSETITDRVNEAVDRAKEKALLEQFVSISEVQEMFRPRLARQTIYNWESAGHLKRHVISNRVYFKYSEVLAALKSFQKFQRSN